MSYVDGFVIAVPTANKQKLLRPSHAAKNGRRYRYYVSATFRGHHVIVLEVHRDGNGEKARLRFETLSPWLSWSQIPGIGTPSI